MMTFLLTIDLLGSGFRFGGRIERVGKEPV